MQKFCKNCGAYVGETTRFCPDCGREVQNNSIRYCPHCGAELVENEYFCKNCGTKLKEPKKESLLDRHKIPIIIVLVIAVIGVIVLGATSMMLPYGSQEVQVDTFSFEIPEDFVLNEDLSSSENTAGLQYVTGYWDNYGDYIQIDVMYTTLYNVDQNEVAKEVGGESRSMMGYNGYYNDLSDTYSFSFVKDNKLITVYTSNEDLFNQISVL